MLFRWRSVLLLVSVVVVNVVGCKDLAGTPGLPAGTNDPSYYTTSTGALGMRNTALVAFEQALPGVIANTGLLTDELSDFNVGASAGQLVQSGGVLDPVDERILPEGTRDPADVDYGNLQLIRTYTAQAIGALVAYDTAASQHLASQHLRGELYALAGYAELYLADFFCSGVPLSTLDFQHDFTYAASDSTAQVYREALTQFDTALTLASDSAAILHLAQVGRGRAWLALGHYDSAAAAVATVPDTFQYQLGALWSAFGINRLNTGEGYGFGATVADREGGNGLPFRSWGDPRTDVDTIGFTDLVTGLSLAVPLTFPTKYAMSLSNSSGFAPVTVASGIEARLIQAEANLHGVATSQGDWLSILNALRATAPIPGTTQPQPDSLPPLSDPGTSAARVTLLFRERAAWLFLSGTRQGDLRRLIRQYGRPQEQVYPTGRYTAPGTGIYGTEVTAPIPQAENINPYFHGCLDRHA